MEGDAVEGLGWGGHDWGFVIWKKGGGDIEETGNRVRERELVE